MFYAEICPMVRRHNARPEGINMGVWWTVGLNSTTSFFLTSINKKIACKYDRYNTGRQ
jgi:hypothetical protein